MPVYSDVSYSEWLIVSTQLTFTCSKSIIKELEDGMKYDQSYFRGRNFCDFRDFCPFLRKFLPSKIVKRKMANVFSSENNFFS